MSERDRIAAEVESLALHAQAAGLDRVHELLHYVAGAIEQGSEDVVMGVIADATTRALRLRGGGEGSTR